MLRLSSIGINIYVDRFRITQFVSADMTSQVTVAGLDSFVGWTDQADWGDLSLDGSQAEFIDAISCALVSRNHFLCCSSIGKISSCVLLIARKYFLPPGLDGGPGGGFGGGACVENNNSVHKKNVRCETPQGAGG